MATGQAAPIPTTNRSRCPVSSNLAERSREGWLGEIAGLEATLHAAEQKLQTTQQMTNRHGATRLGMPSFRDSVGQTAL